MTVHRTFIIKTITRWLALLIFRLSGWRAEGQPPELSRFVVIAAPHTSNWDFLYTVCLALIFRLEPRIMMKDTWFKWPLGPIFRWLGALPIDRRNSTGVVAQSIDAFNQHEKLIMVVPPAGTRRKVMYWKTGFYHIAHGAGVPIVLGFLDYRRKVGGFGPSVQTTGNIESDMVGIREFYNGVTGKYPLRAYHSEPAEEKTK